MLASVLSSPWTQGLTFVFLSAVLALLISKSGGSDGGHRNSTGDIRATNVHVEQHITDVDNSTHVEHHHHHPRQSTPAPAPEDNWAEPGAILFVGFAAIALLAVFRVKWDEAIPWLLMVFGGVTFGVSLGSVVAANRFEKLAGGRKFAVIIAVLATLTPVALCLVLRHPFLDRETGNYAVGLIRLGWVHNIWDLDSSARSFLAGQAIAVGLAIFTSLIGVAVCVGDLFRAASMSRERRSGWLTKLLLNDWASRRPGWTSGSQSVFIALTIVALGAGGLNAFAEHSSAQIGELPGTSNPENWNSKAAVRARALKDSVRVSIFSARDATARVGVSRHGSTLEKRSGIRVKASTIHRRSVAIDTRECDNGCQVSVRLTDSSGADVLVRVTTPPRHK